MVFQGRINRELIGFLQPNRVFHWDKRFDGKCGRVVFHEQCTLFLLAERVSGVPSSKSGEMGIEFKFWR